MDYITTIYLGCLLIEIIGYYYLIKTIILFIKFFKNPEFNLTELKNRYYYTFLFTLCFFGTSIIYWQLKEDNSQLIYCFIHGFVMFINYSKYQELKKLDV